MVGTQYLPSESGVAPLLRRHSGTFLRSLLTELLVRQEIVPADSGWMEDMDAERMVLYGMGAGLRPPENFTSAAFSFPFHKFLFDFLKRGHVTPEDELDADKVVALLVIYRYGPKALEHFPEKKDRYRALGIERVRHVFRIAKMGSRKPMMLYSVACERVRKIDLQRRVHHRVVRLTALIEQSSISPKELWEEHRGIGELLTELTGSDGTVDGW